MALRHFSGISLECTAAFEWTFGCTRGPHFSDAMAKIVRAPIGALRLLSAGSLVLIALAGGCARTPAQKEARFLASGKEKLAKKDYSRALIDFRNAAQSVPNDAEPYYQIALVQIELRNPNSAIAALRKATELNPKHAAAQLKLAAFLMGSADTQVVEGAVDRIQSVLRTNPDDPEALGILGMSELRMGNLQDAVATLQKALDKSPGALKTAVNLSKVKLLQNDAAGAEAVMQKAAQAAPQSALAQLALANFYLAVHRDAEAEAAVRRAVQVEPKNAAALLALANLQVRRGRMQEADQTYRQIAALPDPGLTSAHALFLLQQGRQEEAIAEMTALLKRQPGNRDLQGLVVSAYLQAGRANAALELLDAAIKRNPKDTSALLQRAELYMGAGRLQEAEASVQTVLHYAPNSAEAHYDLAMIYAATRQDLHERQELTDALRFSPALLPARTEMARLMLRNKDAHGALEILDRAPNAQKKDPLFILTRNWVLLSLGNLTELRQGIDQGLAVAKLPGLTYQDALLRMNLKDYAGARNALQQILEQYPESTSSLDLLAQTYAAQGDMPKALQVVKDYASKKPKSAYLLYMLGVWQTKAGNLGPARQAFADAMNANPAFPTPGLLLSEMQLADGDLTAVRQTLNSVLSSSPGNSRAKFLMGLVEERSGNRTAAIDAYRAVVAAEPSNVDALNNLAYNLSFDQPDEALKYAQKAAELVPDNPAAEDTLGWIYYKKHIYSQAVDLFRRAVQKDATALRKYHLGLAYAKVGDTALARQNLADALRLDPKVAAAEPLP